MKTLNLAKTVSAIVLGAAVAAPAAIAGGLTPEQMEEERQNLYADGSLPFIHSPVLYDTGDRSSTVWTEKRIAEFKNLRADGSLPFIHSPDSFGNGMVDSEVIWTDEYIAEWRNLHSDGSLL